MSLNHSPVGLQIRIISLPVLCVHTYDKNYQGTSLYEFEAFLWNSPVLRGGVICLNNMQKLK